MDASEDYNVLLLDEDEASNNRPKGNESQRKDECKAQLSPSGKNSHLETGTNQLMTQEVSYAEVHSSVRLAPSLRNHITETNAQNQSERSSLQQIHRSSQDLDISSRQELLHRFHLMTEYRCKHCLRFVLLLQDIIVILFLCAKKVLQVKLLFFLVLCIDGWLLLHVLDTGMSSQNEPLERERDILYAFILKAVLQCIWILVGSQNDAQQDYDVTLFIGCKFCFKLYGTMLYLQMDSNDSIHIDCIANIVTILLAKSTYNLKKELERCRPVSDLLESLSGERRQRLQRIDNS